MKRLPHNHIAHNDIHPIEDAVTEDFWPFCLSRLEQELPQQQFTTWIKTLRAESSADGVFRLIAPNRFVLQWVRERYLRRIHELGEELSGSPLQVELLLPPVDATRASRAAAPNPTAGASAPAQSNSAAVQAAAATQATLAGSDVSDAPASARAPDSTSNRNALSSWELLVEVLN